MCPGEVGVVGTGIELRSRSERQTAEDITDLQGLRLRPEG